MDVFIPQKGFYRKLRAFQVAEIIYDETYIFIKRFINHGDRTADQMLQAARSGKQNIAEGSAAGATSKETEIKLTNVAKASLQELLIDYEDYLRVRGLSQWDKNSDKALQTRRFCAANNESAVYRKAMAVRNDETIANICIILIHQADVLLHKLIERQKADFLRQGGIREQMSAARKAARNNQSSQSAQSAQRTPSSLSSQSSQSPKN